MKKKLISLLLAVVTMFTFSACKSEDRSKPEPVDTTTDIYKAEQLVKNVNSKFWIDPGIGDGDVYYKEYYPQKTGEPDTAYLWSHFGGLGMQYHYVKANPSDAVEKERYRAMVDSLKYYRTNVSQSAETVKYHSGRGSSPNMGRGSVFFDDNVWTARHFLLAYEVFGTEFYLSEAKKIVKWMYTGWNEKLGGVPWNEAGMSLTNTNPQELERGLSANACGIILNAMLYQYTEEPEYLVWANKFYNFCKTVQDPVTKIYYNGIHTYVSGGERYDGGINEALFSYNSGSMIIADLLMYEITEDSAYLTDAVESAAAAHEAYGAYDEARDIYTYEGYMWFNTVLVDGYVMLAAYENSGAQNYINAYRKAINYAYDKYKDANGFLPERYGTGFLSTGYTDNERQLLTQGAHAEIYALLSMCPA